jgi:glutathione peroxidase
LSAYELPLTALSGEPLDPGRLRGRTALIVNVASDCGLTSQYASLQELYDRYRDRGLMVLGTPCNQFGAQEPGGPAEIAACAGSYAATFPLTAKLDVNGRGRHPLYELLTATPDSDGRAGDVQWNFEKFIVSPRGEPVARFRPLTAPDSPYLIAAVEQHLPAQAPPRWEAQRVTEVRSGARVRTTDGVELTVTRVEHPFLDRDDLACLIEDSPSRWFAQPLAADATVEVLSS